ncbi:YciI family protein [Cellulomonas sp. ATA003]|uniref:YciI family protein n=1 Tax=Cellulomonas sp. ATA003 TaxID=3073064 RepID=UPI00287349E8|nr:YciI family protein [Cellulomonas sp. ATA003]WNB86252.1 YciI family protein [Cellulomonas sp. ATA003]
MPQYFLTVPHDSADEPTMDSMREMDPGALESLVAAVDALNAELTSSGALVHAGGLMPPSTAVTVDASGEIPVRTRAPFVEAPGYVGGFWILDVADEDAAVGWAERASAVLSSRIEVRALQG